MSVHRRPVLYPIIRCVPRTVALLADSCSKCPCPVSLRENLSTPLDALTPKRGNVQPTRASSPAESTLCLSQSIRRACLSASTPLNVRTESSTKDSPRRTAVVRSHTSVGTHRGAVDTWAAKETVRIVRGLPSRFPQGRRSPGHPSRAHRTRRGQLRSRDGWHPHRRVHAHPAYNT